MPIYVYECASCGERFEYTQSLSEAPKTVCEKCSGKLEKVIAPTAFHLKGGGWYKDLYSSKKAGGSSGKDTSSSASGSDSTSSSGDAKAAPASSESKPESKPAAESTPKKTGGGEK